MLVVPIDLEAPKGRLILPKSTIRDLLDGDACDGRQGEPVARRHSTGCAPARPGGHRFPGVSPSRRRDAARDQDDLVLDPLGAQKGDLAEFVRGAMAIDSLGSGDRVLIAEACTHHPIGDDIGRVKIPAG